MGQGLAVSGVWQAGPVQWGFHPSFTRPRCAIMLRPQEIRSSASNTAWRWSRLARPGPGQVWLGSVWVKRDSKALNDAKKDNDFS